MTAEWTPKRTESLVQLWKSGVSTSEIGRKLKVTKNAVVGKAHRLSLPKRQSPIKGKDSKPSKAKTAAASKPKTPVKSKAKPPAKADKSPEPKHEAPSKPVVKPQPVEPKPELAVVRLENLTSGMCCWPIGEPGTPDFQFCGKRPTVPDKPYCLEHCMRAYVKSSKDRKEPARANA